MKKRLILVILIFMFSVTGCTEKVREDKKDILEVGQETGKCIQDIYASASDLGRLTDPETMEAILERLGSEGYSAVDEKNQFNMTHPEPVEAFCQKVSDGQSGEMRLIVVTSTASFSCYEFSSDGDDVKVTKCVVNWNENQPEAGFKEEFSAVSWLYTDKGYLFFERSLPAGYEKTMGYTGIRVKPLDAQCREACREYIIPVNYYLNNMFICDWDETDFNTLNFYDLFEPLYRMNYDCDSPYGVNVKDDRYEIPGDEFEGLFLKYFNMDADTLRKRTVYQKEGQVYQYRPRGMHDAARITDIPYPEVVDCIQNGDGTFTLTVDAIWPAKMMDRAFSHQVMIRPMEDGSFQYVSNRGIPLENAVEPNWYTERTAISILTEEERNRLREEALALAAADKDICSKVDEMNADRYEDAVKFYDAYKEGRDGQVTLYRAYNNGIFGAITFTYREGRLQTCFVGIHWNREGAAEVYQTGDGNIVDLNLTKKGYFIYTNEFTVMHGSLREYFRLKPLPEKCQELTEKYISGLSYVDYELLLNDWNQERIAAYLNTSLFLDIYRMKTGGTPELENGKIPSEVFESVMTEAFPVTVEQLRNNCHYEEESESYPLQRACAKQFAPFGEVVDYRENGDGTLTLFVEAVWTDYNTDCAYKNEILVEPLDDGSCSYLSNKVEKTGTDREVLADEGNILLGASDYDGMANYEKMEVFLEKAEAGEACEAEVYEIHVDGGYGKYRFYFDGQNMRVDLDVVTWDAQGPISMGNYGYQIENWSYTEKGWFSYTLDVPEPPEVSEVIQDQVMMRVRPMREDYRNFTEEWLVPVGYQRNNMLSIEWDSQHMEKLDFNGLYEAFYMLSCGGVFESDDFPEGIPAEEFEERMLKYLPITRESLREYAAYNEAANSYGCANLGCGNYSADAFWTSIPEVVDMYENGDGTWTVTVDAVCKRKGTDRILSHELTVDFPEEGTIRYLGNHILNEGASQIPLYRYRVSQ